MPAKKGTGIEVTDGGKKRMIAKKLFWGVVLTALFTITLSAATITGEFGIAGSGVLSFTSGGTSFIDWCPVQPTDPGAPTVPSGCGTSTAGTGALLASNGTGNFSAVGPFPGSAGTIDDMSTLPSPPFTTFPPGVPETINDFITLTAYPTYNLQANLLVTGACSGTLAGPFCLVQNGQNVSVTITIDGMVIDTSGALMPGPFTAAITGQFLNTTIPAVIAGAMTPAGVFSNTWSGTVSAVPEPATISLLSSGLLFLGLSFRRKRV